jgi:hypothetical protein
MEIGRILVLVGAILTLVSTFFLAFIHITGDFYSSGIGFIYNIPDIMENGDTFVPGAEAMEVYIVTIVFIVFLVSGVIQLIGMINRVVAIIGSIIALGIGIVVLLVALDVVEDLTKFGILLVDEAIAPGVWPLHVSIGDVGFRVRWRNSRS